MGSGGGGGGGNPAYLMRGGTPMPGIPIAGQGQDIDPHTYGTFQSFLPEIQAEGQNPMATGLRPDMFVYKSPQGNPAPSGMENDMNLLRQQLADLQAKQAAQQQQQGMYGRGHYEGYSPAWADGTSMNMAGG